MVIVYAVVFVAAVLLVPLGMSNDTETVLIGTAFALGLFAYFSLSEATKGTTLGKAKVSLDGVTRVGSTALIDDPRVGDYVVLHVGYALAKIDPEEAERTLEMLAQAGALA